MNHSEHISLPIPKKIYWIGPGSNQSTNGLHTRKEFLQIMRSQYPEQVYWRRNGDKVIPPGKIKRNDIEGWLEFASSLNIGGRQGFN